MVLINKIFEIWSKEAFDNISIDKKAADSINFDHIKWLPWSVCGIETI